MKIATVYGFVYADMCVSGTMYEFSSQYFLQMVKGSETNMLLYNIYLMALRYKLKSDLMVTQKLTNHSFVHLHQQESVLVS